MMDGTILGSHMEQHLKIELLLPLPVINELLYFMTFFILLTVWMTFMQRQFAYYIIVCK